MENGVNGCLLLEIRHARKHVSNREMMQDLFLHRSCDDPAPEGNGLDCEFNDFSDFGLYEVLDETCTSVNCPVDGDWSNWQGTDCSATCNAAAPYVSYTRACDDPAPMFGGSDCVGDTEYYKPCIQDDCPGMWGMWMDETTCYDESDLSASTSSPLSSSLTGITCGTGVYEAVRVCDMSTPGSGGSCLDADGDPVMEDMEYQLGGTCEVASVCPVNGNWGDWQPGSCTAACGWGMLQEIRTCDDPAPAGMGMECVRDDLSGPTTPMNRDETRDSNPSVPCYFQHCSPDDSPMSCDFEDMSLCGNVALTGPRWNVRNTATSTSGTGPGIGAVAIASYYAAFESSSVGDDGVAFVSNEESFTITYASMTLDVTDPHACLQFYYHFYSSDDVSDVGDFRVTLTNDMGVDNVILDLNQSTDDDDDEWKRFTYEIDNDSLAAVTFYARATSAKGDKAIDRIGFYPVECDKIPDFTVAAPTVSMP